MWCAEKQTIVLWLGCWLSLEAAAHVTTIVRKCTARYRRNGAREDQCSISPRIAECTAEYLYAVRTINKYLSYIFIIYYNYIYIITYNIYNRKLQTQTHAYSYIYPMCVCVYSTAPSLGPWSVCSSLYIYIYMMYIYRARVYTIYISPPVIYIYYIGIGNLQSI